jgi:ferredoxin
MKLCVDAHQCMGHGRCYTLAPELLDSDDEGYVSTRGAAIDVPPDLLELAEEAQGSCPEGAITLTAQ